LVWQFTTGAQAYHIEQRVEATYALPAVVSIGFKFYF
jgi:hypothetical protein